MCCQTESVWAAWKRSWGIVSGIKRENSAAPTDLHLPSVCHYIGALWAPFGGLMACFPWKLQMEYWAVQTCFFGLQDWQITVWSRHQVCPVFQTANCVVGKRRQRPALVLFSSAEKNVFSQHLPQAQFGFKSPDCSLHVSDMAPPLKLQVEHIQVARDVTQKPHFTQKLFILVLCCVFPFAIYN